MILDGKLPVIVLDYPRNCIYYGRSNINFIGTEDEITKAYVLHEIYDPLNMVDGGFFSVEEKNSEIELK